MTRLKCVLVYFLSKSQISRTLSIKYKLISLSKSKDYYNQTYLSSVQAKNKSKSALPDLTFMNKSFR